MSFVETEYDNPDFIEHGYHFFCEFVGLFNDKTPVLITEHADRACYRAYAWPGRKIQRHRFFFSHFTGEPAQAIEYTKGTILPAPQCYLHLTVAQHLDPAIVYTAKWHSLVALRSLVYKTLDEQKEIPQ